MGEDKLFTVSVSAPGKVILHGEHAVVYGMTAIAASLGLRSSIVIKEISNPDLVINIHLPSVNLLETVHIKPIIDKLFKPSLMNGVTGRFSWKLPGKIDHERHLKNVEDFLIGNKPDFEKLQSNQKNALRGFLYLFSGILGSTNLQLRSMDISLGSELTVGAGTGSSASYAVCLAGALLRLMKLKSSPSEFEAYEPGDDFTQTEKEIISDWAFNCERIMHGMPSGIDNATCTYGAVVSFRKGERPRSLDLRLGMRVLLVDTRVPRETKVLAGKVAALRTRNPGAVDNIMKACDHVTHTATEVLETLSDVLGNSTNGIKEYQHLAELWDMNHCLLSALGVSHPALERIRAAASARGLACKLTGAGGGGYAIVLIPPTTARSEVNSLTNDLFEGGFIVKETRLAGPGVSVDM